jgi:hypothetical protein
MYEFYLGARSGLSAEDIARVRALYDPRPGNTWEPVGGNNSKSTATLLPPAGTPVTYGDIASAADPDWYAFLAPADGNATVELQVAGFSLVSARVVVVTAGGTWLGSATATRPGQDLVVNLPQLQPGVKYFVRVDEAGGTPFAAGQYRLRVVGGDGNPEVITLGGQAPADDPGNNESFLTATRLGNIETDGGTAYRTFARLRAGGDIDVYRIRSPLPGLNQQNVLTATVRAFGDAAPEVVVLNTLGLPVPSRVTADGKGLYTVVVGGAAAWTDYHILVRSRTGAAADYELRAAFRSQVTAPHQVEAGLLTILDPKRTGTLKVIGSAQIYFRLTAALTPVIGPSVVLRVLDKDGRVCFQLLARAGDKVDGVALLGPGTYRVEIRGNGVLLPNILSAFTLETALLTDPTGVMPSDPNDPGDSGQPPSSPPPPPSDPPPPSGYDYYDEDGYYVWGERTPTSDG